jgi:hypothetical protein
MRSAAPALDLRDEARRFMPEVPAIPYLAASAKETWLGRMVNEYASSTVFASLAQQLARAGFSDEEVNACNAFAGEERRHGVLCGAVVEALGGEALAPFPERPRFPEHDDVTRTEAVLRNLLSVCCLSETVAVSLIGAERLEMPEGPLRELLTSIYADEVGHARFGWTIVNRMVTTLDQETKARLGRYLAVAFEHLERHELAHLPMDRSPPPEGVALGLCSGSDARVLFYETVSEIIVPRLSALGLPAERAWESRTS